MCHTFSELSQVCGHTTSHPTIRCLATDAAIPLCTPSFHQTPGWTPCRDCLSQARRAGSVTAESHVKRWISMREKALASRATAPATGVDGDVEAESRRPAAGSQKALSAHAAEIEHRKTMRAEAAARFSVPRKPVGVAASSSSPFSSSAASGTKKIVSFVSPAAGEIPRGVSYFPGAAASASHTPSLSSWLEKSSSAKVEFPSAPEMPSFKAPRPQHHAGGRGRLVPEFKPIEIPADVLAEIRATSAGKQSRANTLALSQAQAQAHTAAASLRAGGKRRSMLSDSPQSLRVGSMIFDEVEEEDSETDAAAASAAASAADIPPVLVPGPSNATKTQPINAGEVDTRFSRNRNSAFNPASAKAYQPYKAVPNAGPLNSHPPILPYLTRVPSFKELTLEAGQPAFMDYEGSRDEYRDALVQKQQQAQWEAVMGKRSPTTAVTSVTSNAERELMVAAAERSRANRSRTRKTHILSPEERERMRLEARAYRGEMGI